MTRAGYRVLSRIAFGMTLPVWVLHSKTRGGWGRRLGIYPERPWPSVGSGPRIWLHGASAGDVVALRPLVRAIRVRRPHATVVLSVVTRSGWAMAQDILSEGLDGLTYLPIDLPGAARRAVRALSPDLLVLEHTELWPNLIAAVRAAGVRIALHNGRLSPRRMARYRFMSRWLDDPLSSLDLLLMRSSGDAERAAQLGVPGARIAVTGTTKWDHTLGGPDARVLHRLSERLGARRSEGDLWWVAGSVHAGEEEAVLAAFSTVRAMHSQLRLLIAPRYPERSRRIVRRAAAHGFAATGVRGGTTGALRRAPVVVLDTLGELASAYGLGALAFVGGTLVPRGGQNLLEPAVCGTPVLFGPHTENFEEAAAALEAGGGLRVNGPGELAGVVSNLLDDSAARAHLGARAQRVVQGLTGVAGTNADRLLGLLDASLQDPGDGARRAGARYGAGHPAGDSGC